MLFPGMLLRAALLFAIVYFAVRLAIKPILKVQEEIITNADDCDVVALRDILVLSDDELEAVIPKWQDKNEKDNIYRQYQNHLDLLKKLMEIGCFSEKDYLLKLDKLKDYFKINEPS